jgi:hypothetical protein
MPGIHEQLPRRIPRECAFVLQFAGHEWSTLLFPPRLQLFETLESLAERLSGRFKTDALAYCVGDVTSVLQYAHYAHGKLKERLNLVEGEFEFKSPSRNVKKSEVEHHPHERAEDLLMDLNLLESGITYDFVRNTLVKHGGWPARRESVWSDPVERIDMVRLQKN